MAEMIDLTAFRNVSYGVAITDSALKITWQNDICSEYLVNAEKTQYLTELMPSFLWAKVLRELELGLPATISVKNLNGKLLLISFMPFAADNCKKYLCSISDGARTYDMISSAIIHDLSSGVSIAKKTFHMMMESNMVVKNDLAYIVERNLNVTGNLVFSLTSLSSDGIANAARETENIYVDRFTEQICTEFAIVAKEAGVAIEFVTEERNVTVSLNSVLLERILSNIIGNAIKFCKSRVSVELKYDEKHALIDISDDGRGIGKNAEKMISAPYEAPDSFLRGGTGLYVAKNIATAMNGNLRLKRNGLEGTTLEISFPKADMPGKLGYDVSERYYYYAKEEAEKASKYRYFLNK